MGINAIIQIERSIEYCSYNKLFFEFILGIGEVYANIKDREL